MAGRNNENRAPRCAGSLKDGSACRTVAEKGEQLCAHHLKLVAEDAGAPELNEEMEEIAEDESSEALAEVAGQRPRVENVRAQLAADSLDEYETIREALLDSLKAEKDAYVSCPSCKKRHPVVVPDWNGRINAVTTLLEQGFGKPQENRAGLSLKDPAAIRAAIDAAYQELQIRPVTEMATFELELVSLGYLLEDEDAAERERDLQGLADKLTRGVLDSAPTELTRLRAGERKHWREVARLMLDALGESDEELRARMAA